MATRKNVRVCNVLYDGAYYDVLVAVDNLDQVHDILQEWALQEFSDTLDLPEALIYNKDITEVITTLDIDNFAYIQSNIRTYMDIPRYAGISGTPPVCPAILSAGLYVMPACTAMLYAAPLFAGVLSEYNVPTKSFTLVAGINNIGIRYVLDANGAPSAEYINYEDDDTVFDFSSIIPVVRVLNFSSNLYVIPFGQSGYGLPEKLLSIMKKRLEYDIISLFTLTTSTNYILLSALTVQGGTDEVDCLAVNTSVANNDMFLNYKDAQGDWQTSAVTTINNTQYQGAGGLASLTGGEFVINYVYRVVDAVEKIIFTVLSNKFASLAAAKESEVITDLPDMIKQNAVLVGRIIVEYNSSSPVVQKVQKVHFGTVA